MNIKDLDLNLLRTLDALLRDTNVSKAAARLGLTQPAVSNQLKRARAVFDDELLVRAPRGMTATPRALALKAPLAHMLEDIERMVRQLGVFDAAVSERDFCISCTDSLQSMLATSLVPLLRAAPKVRIALHSADASVLEQRMAQGDIDIGLVNLARAPGALRSRILFHDRFVVIARKGHPQLRGRVSLDQLCALDHILVSPGGGGFSAQTDEVLAHIGRSRRVRLSVQNFNVVPEMVKHSDCISVFPERSGRSHKDTLQILKPPIELPGFTIAMVWHERTHRDAGAVWLRDRLMALLAKP